MLVRISYFTFIGDIYGVKKEQLIDEVKFKKERNGRIVFYTVILLIVSIVLLNVVNYIVSYS